MASGRTRPVYTAQENDEPPLRVLSAVHDDLDSVLRTSLPPHDPEFRQLAYRRIAWWDSKRIRSWFLEKGYTLYLRCPSEESPSIGMYPSNAEHHESVFPYASHERPEPEENEDDLMFPTLYAKTSTKGNIAFAQNTRGQHVVIKAILDGSEELRVLKYLHSEGVPGSIDDFHHVIPVLDVFPCEGHWLAVMPRWGGFPFLPHCNSVEEVFHFIHCLLKGLTYLHRHRIAHGGIKKDNILVNHVHMDSFDINNRHRHSLRSQGKLTYAIYDFDGSTMFPPSMSLDDCRLPSHVSFDTLYDQVPGDMLQGEIDYNPFAFDVGMLGVMFCQEFQHMTRIVPMLAPLFDRMTTRDISLRLKASEALIFFENLVDTLTPNRVLSLAAESNDRYIAYDYYDRWKHLDPNFVENWAAFHEPPVPRHIRILRGICRYPWGFRTVNYIRRLSRFLCLGWTILSRTFFK